MKDKFKITPADRKILTTLQSNGRASNQDIADAIGSSASSVWRRIRAMEQAGVIDGLHLTLSAEQLGLSETVLVHVSLNSHSEKNTKAFTRLIANTPEVMECYAVTGDHDYQLKVLAPDMRSFYRFLEDTFMSKDYIAKTSSTVVMNIIKQTVSVPASIIPE